ncbi:MAG: FlgD immunoglobulin-like domain containing protein [Candidatus Eiseniibacteriota bacterium]
MNAPSVRSHMARLSLLGGLPVASMFTAPPLAASLFALVIMLNPLPARASAIITFVSTFGVAQADATGGVAQKARIAEQDPPISKTDYVDVVSANPTDSNSASAYLAVGWDGTLGMSNGVTGILTSAGDARAGLSGNGAVAFDVTGSPINYTANLTGSTTSGISELKTYASLGRIDGSVTGTTIIFDLGNAPPTGLNIGGTLAPGHYVWEMGSYEYVASGDNASITSGAYLHFSNYGSQAHVTSPPPPTIVDPFQPIPTLTLPILVAGDAPLMEQWLYNGSPLSDGANVTGSHSTTLSVANFTAAQNGAYSCVVSNGVGTDTSIVAICELGQVSSVPWITLQPFDQPLRARNFFAAGAASSGPLTYQWTHAGSTLADGAQVSGASIDGSQTAVMVINGGTAAEVGDYQCIVTDAFGSVATRVALLTSATTAVAPGAAGTLRFTAGPNPARSSVALDFALPAAGVSRLEIFDLSGRRVATIESGTLEAGPHVYAWDLRDASGQHVQPGVFLARLIAGREARVQRIAVLR